MNYEPRKTMGWQRWESKYGHYNPGIVWTDGNQWWRVRSHVWFDTDDMQREGVFGEAIDPDRERRLVETVRGCLGETSGHACYVLKRALAAYDPPKPRVLPTHAGLWSARRTPADQWIPAYISEADVAEIAAGRAYVDWEFGRSCDPGPVEGA